MKKREFAIGKHINNKISLTFYLKEEISLDFNLSLNQWSNFLGFLKRTESKNYLAKREKGYGGYIFDNDRYGYDRGNQNLSLVKIFKHCLDEKTIKKLLVADSYYIKELNRHLLSRFITLEKNDISLCLPREKFLRLRKYCLNPNNIVDYSAILKHPRSKEPFK